MSVSAPATVARGPLGLTIVQRRVALFVVLLAFFMDLLDTTIVNVAIPSIQRDLGATYAAIQWIVAGYALAFALFLITGGRLGDIFGYKPLFLLGMGGFTLASALCGLAPSTEFLIAARLFQGFMAAMMVPQILSTIQVMYADPVERRNVTAAYGALGGLASVGGPIIGALLITGNIWDLGWRPIFLVNIPIGLIALVLAALYMPAAKSPSPLRLDLVGVAIILVATLMLMFPLIQGRELDWPVWSLVAMALSLVVFVIFGFHQRWKDRRDGSPLVVPALFRERSFVVGVIVSCTFFAVMAGFFLILTIFLQLGLGYTVLKAGLTGIPFSIGVGLAAGLSGPILVPRWGRPVLTVGAVTMAAGLALMAACAVWFGAGLTPFHLAPAMLLAGLGMGMIVAPVFSFVLAGVPIKDAGSASGIINAVGQIGGAIGVALIGVIFFGLIESRAPVSVETVRADLAADLTTAGIPAFIQPGILDGFATCFVDRSAAKDPSVEPESCRAARAAGAAFPANPALDAAIATRAQEANQRNFSAAFERTLIYEIVGLLLIGLLTLLLPARPREEGAELAVA